jgi:hypothetical protein
MEVIAAVLYRGSLAHYSVAQRETDRFVAQLLTYSGDPTSLPPKLISLEKIGRHCVGNVIEVRLMDDIYNAAKEEVQRRG